MKEQDEDRQCFDCKQYRIAGCLWISPWCHKTKEDTTAQREACEDYEDR